jgi:CheY-like chemotaxis protein
LQKSVLLAEDDEEHSWIFTAFLKRKGLNVTSFSDPLKALENFKANIGLYSIIPTDFKMDDMNGMEFAREIRKLRGKSIFIIMITGYSLRELYSR